MKIGLVSDTHGDVEAWEKATSLFEGCDYILHAGDHFYNGAFNPVLPSYYPKNLVEMMNSSPIPILHAKGNCDSEVDDFALDAPIVPFILARLGDWDFLVIHGHQDKEEDLAELGSSYRAHVVVRGHTHLPGVKRYGSLLLVNPGSISIPMGGNPASAGLLRGRHGARRRAGDRQGDVLRNPIALKKDVGDTCPDRDSPCVVDMDCLSVCP